MNYFGMSPAELVENDANWTAREIAQQPEVWGRVQALLERQRAGVDAYLAPLLANKDLRIILTGAGTSAFIGACLAPALLHKLNRRVESIPSTDLVSSPDRYFQADVPTLLISFARSGNSPESMAAVALADQIVRQCHHLVLTCNRDGALYLNSLARSTSHTVLLPDETNDRAFAMTSSFTSLLLSAASLLGVVDASADRVASISAAASDLMAKSLRIASDLAASGFERVIYLGSNELRGLAQEAALKLLELTDGRVVGGFESPLGFRHGPKTIINAKTLVVFFLSNKAHTRHYELDLLRQLRSDAVARVLVLSAQTEDLPDEQDLLAVQHLASASDIELALPYIVFAQLFAMLQSLKLGNRPDHPSASGTVTRVVHGVTIYPWK